MINNIKDKNFLDKIKSRLKIHFNKCIKYKQLIQSRSIKITNIKSLIEVPFLHINDFKKNDLYSVHRSKIFKTLNSSSTTGNQPSKIYLDKQNSRDQQLVLKEIMKKILGPNRMPMLIIEKKPNLNDRNNFSAKYAAIFGFSIFGNNHTYLLDQNGEINYKDINLFLKKFNKDNFFIFGFTFTIFKYLIKKIDMSKINFSMANGILLHGGGWKKMEKYKINNSNFVNKIIKKNKIKKIYNYYGLIEQTGSIFLECENCRKFVTTEYSKVLTRRSDMSICNNNEVGVIQLISTVPTSYPGNSILVEDLGLIHGNHYCNNDNGERKCFSILGRLPKSEIRGCSDTIR